FGARTERVEPKNLGAAVRRAHESGGGRAGPSPFRAKGRGGRVRRRPRGWGHKPLSSRTPLPGFLPGRRSVRTKPRGTFPHGEVAPLLHYCHLRATDRLGGEQRVFGGAGEVVLAGEQIQRAASGVDSAQLAAQISIDPIEVQIALEPAGPTLHVLPKGLVPVF